MLIAKLQNQTLFPGGGTQYAVVDLGVLPNPIPFLDARGHVATFFQGTPPGGNPMQGAMDGPKFVGLMQDTVTGHVFAKFDMGSPTAATITGALVAVYDPTA